MAQAEVGALRARMALDAGEFTEGAKQVEGRLDRLGKRFGITADHAKMAGAAIGAALGGGLALLATSLKRVTVEADAIDELSQKLGIAASTLSKLTYAAEISGTPIANFSMGVRRLSDALEMVAGGDTTTKAGRALDALGISATTSTGQLRPMESVLIDLAAKFESFKDGTGKTAIALALFGETGDSLIPFLNQGRVGIERLAAEADRLGISLTDAAAAAAGQLNENLDKLSKAGDTLYRQIAERVVPGFVTLTEQLIDNGQKYGDVKTGVELASDAINGFSRLLMALDNIVRELSISVPALGERLQMYATLDFEGARKNFEETSRAIAAESERAAAKVREFWIATEGPPSGPTANQVNRAGKGDMFGTPEEEKTEPPIIKGIKAISDAKAAQNEILAESNRLWQEGTRITNEVLTPLELLHQKQEQINKLLRENAISAETASRAMQKAALVTSNAYATAAGSIVNDLGKVFENNKAVAIAQALINTYQSVTNAWANVPWPLNIAAAGAALAAGMAQVANIKSTNKSSSGGGGGGSGGGGGETAGGGTMPQMLTVRGINPGDMFSGAQVRDLAASLLAFQRDGGEVVFQ